MVICHVCNNKGIECDNILVKFCQVTDLPIPCTIQSEDEVSKAAGDPDKMMIAWRYEGLSQVESSFGSAANFGHHFDLSKHVDADTIKNSNITYWKPSDAVNNDKSSKFHYSIM